jgi:hypothetical protein
MINDPGNRTKAAVPLNSPIVKKTAGVIGFILALLLLFYLIPVDTFTLRLPRQSSILAAAVRVKRGQVIILSYRHSVELTRVEGRFQVGTGPCLLLQETRTTSVGTGLPNTYPDRSRRDGDWWVVDENMREVSGFGFFLSPINQTRITAAGEPIDLSHVRAGSILRMNAERVNLLRWFLWRAFSVQWLLEGEFQGYGEK